MNKTACKIQIFVFTVFIGAFFALMLLLPDRESSQQENRLLAQAPAFSPKALFAGSFTRDFEDYLSDQFPLRDRWITLKAGAELASGKQENNDVYLCPAAVGPLDHFLIQRFDAPADSVVQANVQAINTLSEKTGVPVYFALIPGAGELYADLLPANAPGDSQQVVIDRAYALSRAVNVDMASPLSAHREEYIFYGTDHHWTTLGAYYGYAALMAAMDREPSPLSAFSPETVSERFYGTTYSSSGFTWVHPDRIDRYVEQPEGLTVVNYPEGSPAEGALYAEDFLAQKNQYAYFLGGNTPRLILRTGATDAPSLLILRDSYTDSLAPFLLAHFSEIHLLDLRYYRQSIVDYVRDNAIDNILVCYSVSNFSTDRNIVLASR